MRKLSNAELNRIDAGRFKKSEKLPVVIVLDNIRSLNNIGSVFRTADAFRIEAIYLCGISGTPPHREIQKTALGATESVNWIYQSNEFDCVKKLKDQGYRIIAVEQTDMSVMLEDFDFINNEKLVLIFGNEINGVTGQLLSLTDECIEIPQFGTKHSFNVAVSAGIVLWQIYYRCKSNRNEKGCI
jgi:tRNA G18 (ribose-2'-O)-methylase SpoU